MQIIKKETFQFQPWWMRLIRSISYFSYRYWWFVWFLFLLFILLFIFKCYNRKPETSNDNLSYSERFNSIDSLIYNCCDCFEEIPEGALSFPADYLIITYQFNQIGGKDLDTRTQITSPIQTNQLGYCKPVFSSDYIIWSGDNTGYGVESCLIDLTKFQKNDRIEISCGAIWWGKRKSGDMSIDIRAYKGGQMSKEGFQFKNNGGTETAFSSFSDNISLKSQKCSSNELIGTISYDKRAEALFFTPN